MIVQTLRICSHDEFSHEFRRVFCTKINIKSRRILHPIYMNKDIATIKIYAMDIVGMSFVLGRELAPLNDHFIF